MESEVDSFFQQHDNVFNMMMLKHDIQLWRMSAEHVDQLHRQDLLYYIIIDFVSSAPGIGIKSISKDRLPIIKEKLKGVYYESSNIKEQVVKMMISQSKQVSSAKIRTILEEQFKYVFNLLLENDINEYQFTMAFVYPVFQAMFDDISRTLIYQKWNEARSDHIKAHHHLALSDNDRRSLSPNIDALFTLYQFNKLDFFMIEISGALTVINHDHFIGDRNKIAKTLKLMMINKLNTNGKASDANCLKLYGLQVYKNQWFIYSMMTPAYNVYTFNKEPEFKVPTVSIILTHSFNGFINSLWELKQMIIVSFKSYQDYLLYPPDADDTTDTQTSSPYVSPQKRT